MLIELHAIRAQFVDGKTSDNVHSVWTRCSRFMMLLILDAVCCGWFNQSDVYLIKKIRSNLAVFVYSQTLFFSLFPAPPHLTVNEAIHYYMKGVLLTFCGVRNCWKYILWNFTMNLLENVPHSFQLSAYTSSMALDIRSCEQVI